jgi:hypothetical protein
MGKYFDIKELCHSDTANARGIDNTPTDDVKENLEALIENVLDPLREWYGKPIYVNSGYRNLILNRAVGGVSNSQHVKGEAADIDVHNTEENQKLYDYITQNLTFDQCLFENNGAWIHVSYKKDGNNRKKAFALNA